jgi:hypothetical protein
MDNIELSKAIDGVSKALKEPTISLPEGDVSTLEKEAGSLRNDLALLNKARKLHADINDRLGTLDAKTATAIKLKQLQDSLAENWIGSTSMEGAGEVVNLGADVATRATELVEKNPTIATGIIAGIGITAFVSWMGSWFSSAKEKAGDVGSTLLDWGSSAVQYAWKGVTLALQAIGLYSAVNYMFPNFLPSITNKLTGNDPKREPSAEVKESTKKASETIPAGPIDLSTINNKNIIDDAKPSNVGNIFDFEKREMKVGTQSFQFEKDASKDEYLLIIGERKFSAEAKIKGYPVPLGKILQMGQVMTISGERYMRIQTNIAKANDVLLTTAAAVAGIPDHAFVRLSDLENVLSTLAQTPANAAPKLIDNIAYLRPLVQKLGEKEASTDTLKDPVSNEKLREVKDAITFTHVDAPAPASVPTAKP